jgi:hypothetical protein
MSKEHNPDRPRWRDGLVNPRHVPVDFERRFVEIGRVGLEAHYGVGRFVVDHWIRKCGKQRLIDDRADFVRQQHKAEQLSQVAKILSRSFPVEDRRIISDELASAAAQHLRIRRNGGFFISPTGAGDWYVGLTRKSAAELLDMAKARGFDPASLTAKRG